MNLIFFNSLIHLLPKILRQKAMNYGFSESSCAVRKCDDIYWCKGSPLKAVQGVAIRDLTEGQFGSHKIRRTPSPRRRRTDQTYPPPNSLRLSKVSSKLYTHLRIPYISVPNFTKYLIGLNTN